jgi:hypothetical protein
MSEDAIVISDVDGRGLEGCSKEPGDATVSPSEDAIDAAACEP